jgi:hypothetical protein
VLLLLLVLMSVLLLLPDWLSVAGFHVDVGHDGDEEGRGFNWRVTQTSYSWNIETFGMLEISRDVPLCRIIIGEGGGQRRK